MHKAAAQTPPTADPIALDLPEQDVSSYMSEAPSVSQMVRESLAAPAAVGPPAPSAAAAASTNTTDAGAAVPAREQDTGPPERNRIVIIGRRRSGKTIYLASVYAKLWRSLNGLTAKALSGDVHKQLMTAYYTLRQGEWPAATLGTSRMEMEIEHGGRKHLMVTLDFAGELFRKAFLEEQSDWPGVKELVDHIDHAAAVILLVDPSVVAGSDQEAAMDDDFGIVQAVQRIRDWPGGDAVPVVLVLTKMDQYQGLLDQAGSAKEFVKQHFPALVRLLKQIPIFQVSAVQVAQGRDGQLRPRADSHSVNVDAPLRFCLRAIEEDERRLEADRHDEQRRMLEMRLEREERDKDHRATRLAVMLVTTILLLGVIGIALILWYKL
jgi:hypothetical protein